MPRARIIAKKCRQTPRRGNFSRCLPNERFREILKLTPDEQHILANRAKYQKPELVGDMNGEQRETVYALNNPEQVVVDEVTEGQALAGDL